MVADPVNEVDEDTGGGFTTASLLDGAWQWPSPPCADSRGRKFPELLQKGTEEWGECAQSERIWGAVVIVCLLVSSGFYLNAWLMKVLALSSNGSLGL